MTGSKMMAASLTLVIASGAAGAGSVEQDARGFLYGTVRTDSGKEYTGLLRWGTEEAFWDDLFHGTKDELRWLERYQNKSAEKRRSRITVFGVTVGYSWDSDEYDGRLLAARFGDLRSIEPRGEDRAKLVLKSGSTVAIDGGSNDVGAVVTVVDPSIGNVELPWEKIESITFAPAPANIELPAWRLYGTVRAAGKSFEGYVQWDKQESLSTDKLDGEGEDGTLAIAMGQIRSIERRNASSSRVVLVDGREFVMRGTNDVNDENRGICVEVERLGRIEIPWDAFESLELRANASSGRGYADYRASEALRGTLTERDGKTHRGRLVIDLDESEGWEILNGSRDGIAYDIPLALVRSIEPDRWDSSRVVLRDGVELLLEEGQDVAETNAGVVVLTEGEKETFVPWQEVRRIELD